MTLKELRKKFIDGSLTPLAFYESMYETAKKENADINAYIELFDAREEAKQATERYEKEGEHAPALLGIPLAIKNNILIKGKRTTAASRMLKDYLAPYDATVIKKLKEAGALFMGSANMDDFAMGSTSESSVFGPTKNPVDKTRVPGGSSGGSAAAVKMGGAHAALGTDTGGSVRLPASFCGLYGFKPTYGRVSRHGLIAMGSSLDQAGVFGQCADDIESIFDVIEGNDPYDSTSLQKSTYEEPLIKERYRIGIPRDFLKEGMDPRVLRVFEAHAEKLAKAGHEIVDIELPLFKKGLAAYYIVMPAEVSSNLSRYDGVRYGFHADGDTLLEDYMKTRAEGFGSEVKRRILLGTYVLSSGYYDAYYAKAEHARDLMREELKNVFADVDLFMTPTAPTPAYKIGEKTDPLSMYLGDIFTVPTNLTGIPAMSVPAGTVEEEGIELPVGVQYSAPLMGDRRLFDIAKKI